MRQLAAIAALWGCVAMAQAASGVALLEDEVLRRNGTAAPLFSFASPTVYRGYRAYSGLPATDGCYAAASVTGTKGEALTFTRATTRFCPTDGTTNEATGVMCTSGQVCISTLSSKRGISVFRAGTKTALRSEEMTNAAWASGGGCAVPTFEVDAAVAPDGTTTAEIFRSPATSATTGCSRIYQTAAFGANGAGSASIWLKGVAPLDGGVAQSGSFGFNIDDGTGAAGYKCKLCSYSTEWTRCKFENQTIVTYGSSAVAIGNDSRTATCSQGNQPASDVAVWGLNTENSPYATPYVKTEGTAVTRNAETATFALNSAAMATTGSASVSFAPAFSGTVGPGGGLVLMDGSGRALYYNGAGPTLRYYDGANEPSLAITLTANTVARYYSWWRTAPSNQGNINGSNATFDGTMGTSATLGVCYHGTVGAPDGLCSDVCLDSSDTRCR